MMPSFRCRPIPPMSDYIPPEIARALLRLKASLPDAQWKRAKEAFASARERGLSPEFSLNIAEIAVRDAQDQP